jgi:transcriptional regulator with XRE-family HTH domain
MKNQSRRERSARLRQARISAHLSQQDMANRLGCSRQLVGVLEAGGNLSADQLEAWCVACSCSADTIVFGAPHDDCCGDEIAQQFARLEPGLRQRLWMLYQVFVRRPAPDGAAVASSAR